MNKETEQKYRLLKPGEIIQEGDEFFGDLGFQYGCFLGWMPVTELEIFLKLKGDLKVGQNCDNTEFRRRIIPAWDENYSI